MDNAIKTSHKRNRFMYESMHARALRSLSNDENAVT